MRRRRRRKKGIVHLIEELSLPYTGTAEPVCPCFGRCGGCLFQNISYDHQLSIKAEYLKRLLAGVSSIDPFLDELKVTGSDPVGYRNRMDFVCAFGMRGLRERGAFDCVVDIEKCYIMSDRMNSVWHAAREAVSSIEDYNYLNHTGYLRYGVVRGARFTNEIMLNFVVAGAIDPILPAAKKMAPLVDSLSVIHQEGLADLSMGVVLGDVKRGYIEERFDDIIYRITPNSFFQSNSPCAVQIYRRIAELARGRVLDLFSGVGSITLFVAKHVEEIIGVEIVAEAVESARANAERNNITNATFVCTDALPYMKENARSFDTLILDPPRSGAHPKVMKGIAACAPERIIYVSCNPVTFKENVELLHDYTIVSFEAFDMFPQTPHLESIAVLERKGE
jgi:23S rRNA (uracil-5-)-methyltransferase RumA